MAVNALDVADYILRKRGPMSAMKLQKLVYYAQAWHLVWTDKPLFREKIEAWASGPVVPRLYKLHRGLFELKKGFFMGDPGKISADSQDVIDKVLAYYGDRDSQWLSELTHLEHPWRDARVGVPPGERSTAEITRAALAEYYCSL